jgi:preprotein translocase subunit Sec63
MRFVTIIIFIVVGYFIFRNLMRVFRQEMHRRNERGGYQGWESAHTEQEYRETLGITDKDSPAKIRTRYRELLTKYHPDKVQHLGIEFQEMAEKKTKAIMEAYEFFQKKYNL